MSKQIIKKFIGADAVDGSKIKLLNNQALRVRNAADSADLNVLKLNASDDLVLNASEIDMSAAILKNMPEMRVSEIKIGASNLAIFEDTTSTEQSALSFGANEVLSSAAPSENSSLTNKLYVDNAIAGVSSAATSYKKYAYTLQAGDVSNGYIDLQDAIVHDSLVSGMNRQFMVGNGVDFSLADVDGVTRMTFANDFASGGDIAIAAGDILYVVYRIA